MPKLEIDETTAQALSEAAGSLDMSVGEFLRFRMLGKSVNGTASNSDSAETFDAELDELIFAGSSPLPADFSRSDIYTDHD